MALALLFHCLMLNRFRMLIHPSPEACDLYVEFFLWFVLLWFDVLRCGLAGVVW